ncbi:conserved hypothetical protein [Ricinus communis]|uniref:Uncharacterized protein n=1 Tax=Ricinus communis TaxID=3988 RepID=B9S7D8_RICCO|nr:conserved hypothetical protein [Ricinus communis]
MEGKGAAVSQGRWRTTGLMLRRLENYEEGEGQLEQRRRREVRWVQAGRKENKRERRREIVTI